MALEARGSTISKLHDHQLDAIALLLAGERVIQRIQTGGGKTLVIFLSIILRKDYPNKYPGPLLTLVFTPTRILLEDTLRRFNLFGINCWVSPAMKSCSLQPDPLASASVIPEPNQKTLLKISRADVILTTVEFFNSPSPKAASARLAFANAPQQLTWIDEGDSGMVDSFTYRSGQHQLKYIPSMYPESAILISSATWTVKLMREGIEWYNIPHAHEVVGPADRENLHVMRMNAKNLEDAKSIVKSHIRVSLHVLLLPFFIANSM